MKAHSLKHSRKGEQGKTILIALLIVAFVTPMLMSTLKMASIQHRTVAFSQDWNASVPVVEAGIEEAFAHLNYNCTATTANGGTLSWVTGPWHTLADGSGIYCDRRTCPDGSYYDVRIITNGAGSSILSPQIVCVGNTPALVGQSTSGPLLAFLNRGTNTFISRQIRVQAGTFSWFGWGMIAGGNITWSGQGMMDSFDSASSDHSYFGAYYEDWHNDNSLVGSLGGNISLGPGSVVYGNAATGGGSISGGTIGDEAWIDGGNSGIQPGHSSDDLHETMDEVSLPDTSGWISLSSCSSGCTITITNQIKTNTWLYSTNYPTNTPPGNLVLTNSPTTNTGATAVIGATTLPNPLPSGTITTSTAPQVSFTYPNNLPAGTIVTTNTTYWTNSAQTEESLPVYPTGGLNITPLYHMYTNLEACSPPPSGVYMGTLTATKAKNNGCGSGNSKYDSTNYVYNHLHWYRYQTNVYSWTNYTYSYTNNQTTITPTMYSYMGPRTEPEAITDKYTYVTPETGGNYIMNGNISMSGHDKMLIRGTNNIYVTGSFSMAGQSQIVLEEGAKVTFYFAGDVSIGGNGVANYNDTADKLVMYGLNTCKNFDVSGNGNFIGAIYAPDAAFTANGGGSSGMMIGSIAANTVTMHGHPHLAYDENLKRVLPSNGYRASDWKEEAVGTTP